MQVRLKTCKSVKQTLQKNANVLQKNDPQSVIL